jgi:hypothetical protein
MESRLLGTLGRIAGLGGIALGVFLLVFQGVLRARFLPQAGLASAQAFAVILSLMILTFGIAAIGVVAWLISRSTSPKAPISGLALGVLAVLITLVLVAAAYVGVQARAGATASSQLPDFENVATWSVSFKIGGLLAGGHFYVDPNDPTYAIGLPECRFYNLSTTQRRMIDITLVIPTKDSEMPSITLSTETLDFQYKPSHRDGLIDLPIILEPSSKIEGRIDFNVDGDVKDKMLKYGRLSWLRYSEATIYVKEHRSGKTITVKLGQSYDAVSGTITRP